MYRGHLSHLRITQLKQSILIHSVTVRSYRISYSPCDAQEIAHSTKTFDLVCYGKDR